VALRRGVALVLVLMAAAVVVSFGALALVVLFLRAEPAVPANAALFLRVGGEIVESEPVGLGRLFEPPPTLRSIVGLLRKAKTDRRVRGVVVMPAPSTGLWATAQELRDAIADFKTSKKPIVGYLEYGGQQEYLIASACDKVFLSPSSPLDLTGVALYELFLRGALDKIGVYPDLLHIGEYKTASNTFTERTYTPAHREMARSLVAEYFEQLVRAIAESRRKPEAEVRAILERGPMLPEEAVRVGLVDDLAYEDQIDDKVNFGGTRVRRLEARDYRRVEVPGLAGRRRPRIAVLYADGLIAPGRSSYDPAAGRVVGSETLTEYIRRVRADDAIKAVVLRVDSPGGSAIASDVIWRELMLTRPSKPVVASFGDVAASGGYYIAMPAHVIVAQPGTLTGSIGVVAGKFAFGGTLARLGVGLEATSQGAYAEMGSPVRRYTPAERAKVEEQMQAFYDTFVEKAAQSRNRTPEQIDAVAQGRVWTGRQARRLGLVDELGGLERAVAIAKERARIAPDVEVELVVYPPRRTFYELIRDPFGGFERIGRRALGWPAGAAWEPLAALWRFRMGEPLALMPNVFLSAPALR
jgi:protease-4